MRQLIEARADALATPDGVVDRARLLGAICANESGGWNNRQPNFEPGYWVGGKYFSAPLHQATVAKADPVMVTALSALTACSFGPFQIMYPVAVSLGFRGTPLELADPRINIEFAIRYLNIRGIGKMPGDRSTEEWVKGLADAYNTGSPNDTIRNTPYETDAWLAYQDEHLWDHFIELPEYYRGTW